MEFLTRIAPVVPGLTAAYNGRVSLDDWPVNPWTLGSYSYWKTGQYTRFAGVEGEMNGGCHFAGEHTSIDSQGYLNGAVESGERAAREVQAALGLIQKRNADWYVAKRCAGCLRNAAVMLVRVYGTSAADTG